jgi:restriction endonuclease S subunit
MRKVWLLLFSSLLVIGFTNASADVADSHVTVLRAPSMNSEFLWSWSASPRIQRRIESLTSGSTNQQELNLATLKTLLVPVPQPEEKTAIIQKLKVMMDLCDQLEAQLRSRNLVADDFSLSATLTHLR